MRRLAALLALVLLAGCGPVGSPSSNPDHGPPKPPNGNIINPDRPQGMPADFLFVSWHVLALDENWEEGPHVPVKIHVEATGDAPVQGNVRGIYPFDDYVYTPYTHTIWYAPGVTITTSITAVADPPFKADDPQPISLICIASSSHHIEEPIYEHTQFQIQDFCRAIWNSETGED